MPYFSWHDDLSVGESMIDADHRHLIDLINRLHANMELGKGKHLIAEVLAELFQYASAHFKREEAYMHRILYVGFTAHKKEHQSLLQELRALQEKFDAGTLIMSVPVLHFLRDWLRHHILESDKALAIAVRKSDRLN